MLDLQRVRLGIAPIGWTNDDLTDLGAENTFEQCISEMALAGFTGTELGNKYPQDTAVLSRALNLRGLSVCNAWFSTLFTSEPYDQTIARFIQHRDRLHALGATFIGASEQGNSIQGKPDNIFGPTKPVYTDAEWALITRGFNEMGRLAQDLGMTLTIHHHMGTGIQTAAEIDRLMASIDPDLVYLLFDSGHLSFAGIDPLPILEKYLPRIRHVHLKDLRAPIREQALCHGWSFLTAVRAGVFTVPGDGDVNFQPIFDLLSQANYQGWIVVEAEQDPAKANPFEYALKARRYLRETAGV